MLASQIKYSIVVPVFNGSKTLNALFQSILKTFESTHEPFEIVFVDDGSKDDSWEILKSIKKQNSNTRLFRLVKNFGQYASTVCGVAHARGQLVVTIDDDLQYHPSDILPMEKLLKEKNYQLVYGNPIKRQHSPLRKMAGHIAGFLLHAIFLKGYEKKVFYSSFRIFRRELIDGKNFANPIAADLDTYFHWLLESNQVGFLDVEHHKRQAGKTGYSFSKKIFIYSNTYFTWAEMPLRYILYLFVFSFLITMLFSLLIIYGVMKNNFWLMTGNIFLLFLFFISFVILTAYLGKIYKHLKGKPFYIISEQL